MQPAADVGAPKGSPTAGLDTGTVLGKRYSDGTVELLVTHGGAGTLTLAGEPLQVQGARQLPSSD